MKALSERQSKQKQFVGGLYGGRVARGRGTVQGNGEKKKGLEQGR